MAANKNDKKEEQQVQQLEKIQTAYKLDVLQTEVQGLKVSVAQLPQNYNGLWAFSILNFIVNCLVLVVLYLNLHP